jgi:hypothetical protein
MLIDKFLRRFRNRLIDLFTEKLLSKEKFLSILNKRFTMRESSQSKLLIL